MINAFFPRGKTISFTTSGSASTSQSRPVLPSDFGRTDYPEQIRIVNKGASDVWVWFTQGTFTIAIPTAGTTTVGTPQNGIILIQNVVEVFTLPVGFTYGTTPLWISDISTGTSMTYHILGGNGV